MLLRDAVRDAYSAVAASPRGRHPFPVGRRFAVRVGYPDQLLAELPAPAVDAFAGVSNVSLTAPLEHGATVLDLGCGSGLDTLLAARMVGPAGRVLAVDFSETMLARTREAVGAMNLNNVVLHRASGEELPLDDDSVDVAMVNGIFNLNPRRTEIMRELVRVIRPGGQLRAAELVLARPVERAASFTAKEWFT